MSETDGECFEVESEDDYDEDTENKLQPFNSEYRILNDKRHHHNLLERKRRYSIRDAFHLLRDEIPSMYLQGDHGKPKASRAQILKGAASYITDLHSTEEENKQKIEDLKMTNDNIEREIKQLEHIKMQRRFSAMGQSSSAQRVPSISLNKTKRQQIVPYNIIKSEKEQSSSSLELDKSDESLSYIIKKEELEQFDDYSIDDTNYEYNTFPRKSKNNRK